MTSATEVRATVCTLDCPDTCSLAVTVQDEQVIGIRGSLANPYTDKAICSKVARFYPEYVHGKQRLTHPLKRVGPRGSGEYQRISWPQALDLVYEGFTQAIKAHGPQSVIGFNYAGPHGELAAGSMDRRFFNKLGATKLDRGPLCGGVKGGAYASLFGDTAGMPPEQVMDSDLVVMWGNNATVSNLHLARVLKKAQQTGCKLVVIDPKQIPIADRAELFIQINPGTDVVFAMGLAAELERRGALDHAFIDTWVLGAALYLEQARAYTREQVESICGVSLQDFDALASLYEQSNTVSASFGNGIERGKSGGSGLRAAMALQALTGNFGHSGAGVIAKAGLSFPRDSERLEGSDMCPDNTRTLNILDVSRTILDESIDIPVKALMIYNHNPIATHPDQHRMQQALSKESVFIAGCDVVMTDSMSYADVILPAASMFEIEDIYASYGHNYLQRAEAVIEPVGEALPNTEIFRRLAARFGFEEAAFKATDKQLIDEAFIDNDARLKGQQPSELAIGDALLIESEHNHPLIMCDTVKPSTPSGKIELFSQQLEDDYGFGVPRYEPLSREATYPFMIISPSSNDRTNATFGGCEASLSIQALEIHPDDAADLSIANGDKVKVWNTQGEVYLKAQLSSKVKRGVLYTPKGAWQATSQSQHTVNALISVDMRTDIMDGACYNDTLVAVEKVA
ncbi:molybdopterin oxidoreductase family protein [Leucothrix sargassi]|nr:molybdopterin oxidoreductase family protein [Leucothrix sargassi]